MSGTSLHFILLSISFSRVDPPLSERSDYAGSEGKALLMTAESALAKSCYSTIDWKISEDTTVRFQFRVVASVGFSSLTL